MKYYAASFIGTQYAIGRFYKLALTDCETIFFEVNLLVRSVV